MTRSPQLPPGHVESEGVAFRVASSRFSPARQDSFQRASGREALPAVVPGLHARGDGRRFDGRRGIGDARSDLLGGDGHGRHEGGLVRLVSK